MPSTECHRSLNREEQEILLKLALSSIQHGLQNNNEPLIQSQNYPARLLQPGASFVTLHLDHTLRGCIGTLEAFQPLIHDVARNAYSAAFRDPRFPPLTNSEFAMLEIHISILGEASELHFSSEAELIAQLRPGIDGLILRIGNHRGTFLPSVWQQLPEPRDFLRQLKLKAGLPADFWSDTLTVQRYTVQSFPE